MDIRMVKNDDLPQVTKCLKRFSKVWSKCEGRDLGPSWIKQVMLRLEIRLNFACGLFDGNSCKGIAIYSEGKQSIHVVLIYCDKTKFQDRDLELLIGGILEVAGSKQLLVSDVVPDMDVNLQKDKFLRARFEEIVRYRMIYDKDSLLREAECSGCVRLAKYNPGFKVKLAELDRLAFRGHEDEIILDILADVYNSPPSVRMVESADGSFDTELSKFAFDDKKLVGAIYCIQRETDLVVANIAIHPDYQSHGLGKCLLSHVIRGFKGGIWSRLCLTVSAKNKRAIDFYKKYNFCLERTYHNFVYKVREHK